MFEMLYRVLWCYRDWWGEDFNIKHGRTSFKLIIIKVTNEKKRWPLDTILSLAAEKFHFELISTPSTCLAVKRVQINLILKSLTVTEMVLRSPFTNSLNGEWLFSCCHHFPHLHPCHFPTTSSTFFSSSAKRMYYQQLCQGCCTLILMCRLSANIVAVRKLCWKVAEW